MANDLPRVLGVAEAHALGVSGSAIRHGIATRGWQRLLRGAVLTRADPPTREDWIHAGLVVAGPDAALSGWDAARIRGIGDRRPPDSQTLVLTRVGRQRTAAGVRVRRTDRPYRVTILPAEHPTLPFVPIVHLARAATDTALLYDSRAPVRALLTSAIQRRCRPDELLAEYESGPRGGSYWLRRALQDVAANAHSIAEAEAADALRVARVPSFELNVDIVDRNGRLIARADVLWRELRAVGEVQSRAFHFSEESWNASMARHNELIRHSLAVAHWPPSVIRRSPDAWSSDVAGWLRARASELGVPYRAGVGALPMRPGGHPPLIVG